MHPEVPCDSSSSLHSIHLMHACTCRFGQYNKLNQKSSKGAIDVVWDTEQSMERLQAARARRMERMGPAEDVSDLRAHHFTRHSWQFAGPACRAPLPTAMKAQLWLRLVKGRRLCTLTPLS